jgi:hypothetical protein
MMRNLTLVVLGICMMLAACTKPTDTVIPSDMATWDKDLAPVVQKLGEEDKTLFVGFVARKKLADTFSKDKAGIPFGMTVSQAIEEQRQWQVEFAKAQAVAKAEQERQAAEELALKTKLNAQKEDLIKQFNASVTVTLLAKKELPKDYSARRYSESQQFVIGVENRSSKELTGVSGEIEFIDVFDKVVGGVNFAISEKIKPGATYKWYGGRDYNQFVSEHRAVWGLE